MDVVKFSIGTLIGISPFLVISVYLGSISRNLTTALSGDDRSSLISDVAWIIFVVVISVINFTIIGWYGKKELQKALSALDALENNSATTSQCSSDTELATLSQSGDSEIQEIVVEIEEKHQHHHHHNDEENIIDDDNNDYNNVVHHIDIEGTV